MTYKIWESEPVQTPTRHECPRFHCRNKIFFIHHLIIVINKYLMTRSLSNPSFRKKDFTENFGIRNLELLQCYFAYLSSLLLIENNDFPEQVT